MRRLRAMRRYRGRPFCPPAFGPPRIWEDVQVGEGQGIDEAPRLLEIVFGLARKSHHHVRAKGGVRHPREGGLDAVAVIVRMIFAVHEAEDAIEPLCRGA